MFPTLRQRTPPRPPPIQDELGTISIVPMDMPANIFLKTDREVIYLFICHSGGCCSRSGHRAVPKAKGSFHTAQPARPTMRNSGRVFIVDLTDRAEERAIFRGQTVCDDREERCFELEATAPV